VLTGNTTSQAPLSETLSMVVKLQATLFQFDSGPITLDRGSFTGTFLVFYFLCLSGLIAHFSFQSHWLPSQGVIMDSYLIPFIVLIWRLEGLLLSSLKLLRLLTDLKIIARVCSMNLPESTISLHYTIQARGPIFVLTGRNNRNTSSMPVRTEDIKMVFDSCELAFERYFIYAFVF